MPEWRKELQKRLPGLPADIIRELEQHLEDRYAELRADGESEVSAYHQAIAGELTGSGKWAREQHRFQPSQNTGGTMFGNLGQDLRYAARMLAKNSGFALIAILTLAAGVGANTAIFTVVNAVMIRPLPYPDSDRLVSVFELTPQGDTFSVSQPTFLDWKQQSPSFDAIAAYAGGTFNLSSNEGVERVRAIRVTAGFLPTIGILPALGRNFTEEEDRPASGNRVVIVSHSFWQNRLGGDAGVLGKTIVASENSYTVIGVMPKDFPWEANANEMFVPLAPDPSQNRADHRLGVLGRMKPEMTVSGTMADMTALAKQIGERFPASNKDWGIQVQTLYDLNVPVEIRRSLLVLLAAAGFVMLITCSNVANLLLARASARHKEMSIRMALGSGRYRVIRQLLTEALLMAALGGVLGLGLAVAGTAVLKRLGPENLPRLNEITVDARVLTFSLGLALAAGILFGLAPAIHASKPNLNESLKDGGRVSGGSAGQRLRSGLVILEVALSVALLAGAGVLMRSFWMLQNVHPGFEPSHLLTMRLNLPAARYSTKPQSREFYDRLLENVRAVPGIQSASVSSNVPMGGGNTGMQIVPPGDPASATKPFVDWRIVSPDYFKTLAIPVRGREFGDGDLPGGPPVVIISEEMAGRYFPGQDPIGKWFQWEGDSYRNTIVGIAGNVQNTSLDSSPRSVVYMPLAPNSNWNPMILSLRTSMDPALQVSAIRSVVGRIDPNVPVYGFQTAQQLMDLSLGDRRFRTFLLGCFATIALLLSCAGLFGVMAYLVAQRTHEIGIRLSLGAGKSDVFRLVVGHGMLLAVVGSVLGLIGAFGLGRWLQDLLYRVRPTDPLSFAAAVILLLFVSLLACYVPARRATRVDPLIALRHE